MYIFHANKITTVNCDVEKKNMGMNTFARHTLTIADCDH